MNFSINELIQMAIQIEEKGKLYYEQCLPLIKHPELKKLFTHLAKEEEHHKESISALSPQEHIQRARLHPQTNSYLNALIESSLFNPPTSPLRKVQSAHNEKELLNLALAFEKDTILFFYEMLEHVEPIAKKLVIELIQEEKQHIKDISLLLANSALTSI